MRESYALTDTLELYEVEEIDALDLACFLDAEAVDNEALEGFLSQFDREIMLETV